MKTETAFEIVPAGSHIGADVRGVDLASVVDEADLPTVEALRRELDQHLVLRLRDQHVSASQMERFGAYFGGFVNLKRAERPDAEHIPGLQFVKCISNGLRTDGRPVGDGSAASQDWHTDGAMKPKPATYSHFYARVVPAEAPKTYWMNMYRVYESLPDDWREEIQDVWVIHHQYSAGNEFPLPPSLPLAQRMEGPRHPLVRSHPVSGRPLLYLPHRDDAMVVGMDEQGSYELISRLRRFAAKSPFWWAATMEVDDFVIWDNRACLHRRDGWDASRERTLWHLANEGEVPVPYREPSSVRLQAGGAARS